MAQILRFLVVILITVVLVVIVTDFESVTNGFANFVYGFSALLGWGR